MSAKNSEEPESNFTPGNKVVLIRGGKPYFDAALNLIENAQEIIHLQTYIFENDETGQAIGQALIRAANRKVQIYLLVDGYASQHLDLLWIRSLEKVGIHFRFFEPLFKSKYHYFGRRLHHKILAVDSRQALVGGINISNHYNDFPGKPAWLDFALRVEGPVVGELFVLCSKTWNGFSKVFRKISDGKMKADQETEIGKGSLIRMRRNDWVRGKNQVSKSYREILLSAKSEVLIVCSYFLPGKKFKGLISNAIKRNVKIKLVLAGPSDVGVAKQAERHIYRWILKQRVELYEYKPSILHAKMAMADSRWMTLGSFNVNDISALASIELNLDVRDPAFVLSVRQKVESIIQKDCIRITEKSYSANTHFLQRLWQDVCYETVKLLIFLFTFYFRQKE